MVVGIGTGLDSLSETLFYQDVSSLPKWFPRGNFEGKPATLFAIKVIHSELSHSWSPMASHKWSPMLLGFVTGVEFGRAPAGNTIAAKKFPWGNFSVLTSFVLLADAVDE